MRIDYSPRASGKTTRLIEWLKAKPDRFLLTFSHDEENRLKRLHPDLSNRIVDWRSYQRRFMHGSPMHQIAIDNVDLVLEEQFRQRIAIASISDEQTPQWRLLQEAGYQHVR
ncbi:hypothetical protein [Reyranella soli]|jgi:hypothetical protein|uniref:hypothetical protein n=1 Tax=Reyranella soli TaxID=1230389 RepID=UPI0011BE6E34|nr:hypothetical protein [Reyranella soli]